MERMFSICPLSTFFFIKAAAEASDVTMLCDGQRGYCQDESELLQNLIVLARSATDTPSPSSAERWRALRTRTRVEA
jgi:hypothetical protein